MHLFIWPHQAATLSKDWASVLAFSLSMYADGRTLSEKDDISSASTVVPTYPRFA